MIQSLLDETGVALQQLDAIVMVSGPGSFTGLRIGAAVAQGLSFGADVPIIRISSLEMLARAAFTVSNRQVGTATVFYTCLHAREDEFYFAAYADDGLSQPKILIPDQMSNAATILAHLTRHHAASQQHVCVGSGWLQSALLTLPGNGDSFERLSDTTGNAVILCELGRYVLATGETDSAEQALPEYLKEDMAYRKS